MIPKKIHYCWFGGKELPKLAQKCLESWKKFCPDYEIVRWDESNFDLTMNGYTRMCVAEKKWAFLSDYVRLWVVAHHGGIYFDTDVELLRSPDELLQNEAFFGFETAEFVNTGQGFGSVAGGEVVTAMLAQYDPLLDGEHGTVGCPRLNTAALLPLGLQQDGTRQNVAGADILPIDWLNPYESTTGRLNKTKNTLSIHWYTGAWLSPKQRVRLAISKPLHRLFGNDFMQRLKK